MSGISVETLAAKPRVKNPALVARFIKGKRFDGVDNPVPHLPFMPAY